MKKLTLASFFVFASILVVMNLNGCGEENVISPTLYLVTEGAYILSEGTSPTNSKLSFYSATKDLFYQSIYSGNLALPDGLEFFNSDLYLVEQGPSYGGPGKLYQLDSNGGLKISSSPFGSSPYSIAITSSSVFITNGPGSKVSVLDLAGLTFMQDITVGVFPQEMIGAGWNIFVCNTSAYGGNSDSTISVIDINTKTVVKTIVLRKDPTSIKRNLENGDYILYAGCQGGGGLIYKIDAITGNKLDSFSLPNGFDKDLAIYNGSIYFISGSNNIDKLDLSTRAVTTFITNPGAPAYFYGYNIDAVNGKHYVLDAKNFSIDGSLYIYGSGGSLERTFTTGVGPRRVVFKAGSTAGGS